MKLLNFKNEGLTVDWIGFNIQGSIDQQQIANYLYQNFGFNSTLTEKINGKWHCKTLFHNNQNQFQVSFRQYQYDPQINSFWNGAKINFSGNNAKEFYKIIQQQSFNWSILPEKTTIARLDVCHFRKNKITDPKDFELQHFMQESCKSVREKYKRRHASWQRNSKGLILKIGKRTSSNYYRVYQKNRHPGLRFELEIKHKATQSFQKLLVDNRIKEFEHSLSKHFYLQSFKSLSLNAYCTDWLLHWYRINSSKPQTGSLITTYLVNKNNQNEECLFYFLKLLSFINTTRSFISKPDYYLVQAPLQQFIQYVGMDHTNQRHRTKTLNILRDLQKLQPILKHFFELEFRSLVNFSGFKIEKNKRSWMITLEISKQLYEYKYPYQLTTYFLQSQNQYHSQVQFFVICALSNHSQEKCLNVQQFLTKFNISNQKRTHIKKYIIQAIHQLEQVQLIQTRIKLIKTDGSLQFLDIHQLTTKIITLSRHIQLKELIQYKNIFN